MFVVTVIKSSLCPIAKDTDSLVQQSETNKYMQKGLRGKTWTKFTNDFGFTWLENWFETWKQTRISFHTVLTPKLSFSSIFNPMLFARTMSSRFQLPNKHNKPVLRMMQYFVFSFCLCSVLYVICLLYVTGMMNNDNHFVKLVFPKQDHEHLFGKQY